MRYFKYLFLCLLLVLTSCRKTKVDGSSMKDFQSSVNDLTMKLPTLKQIKFNEALFIIKRYGTGQEGDVQQMEAMAKMLDGKNTSEILTMADEIARKEEIDWSSTAPPSLGEMNIFAAASPTEIDPNDIEAARLDLSVLKQGVDSLTGPHSLQVVPHLVNNDGEAVQFSNASLDAQLEVVSGGVTILRSKNIMTNNNFKGFLINIKNLPADQVRDNLIDVRVQVKTARKNFVMTKTGISVNPAVFAQDTIDEDNAEDDFFGLDDKNKEEKKTLGDPTKTVSDFIRNVGNKNLRAAFSATDNPAWGSYETFSNPASGFGAVEKIEGTSLQTSDKSDTRATVNASYTVTDNGGKETRLEVVYLLSASADGWKITGYKINSAN